MVVVLPGEVRPSSVATNREESDNLCAMHIMHSISQGFTINQVFENEV